MFKKTEKKKNKAAFLNKSKVIVYKCFDPIGPCCLFELQAKQKV